MIKIILERDDIAALSEQSREEILRIALLKDVGGNDRLQKIDPTGLAILNPIEAKLFIDGLSEKTRTVLRSIVDQGDMFLLSKVAKQINVPANSMRGVWTALTKRTRTVKGDASVHLIDWYGAPQYDRDGIYVDQEGRLAPETLRSFVSAFRRIEGNDGLI